MIYLQPCGKCRHVFPVSDYLLSEFSHLLELSSHISFFEFQFVKSILLRTQGDLLTITLLRQALPFPITYASKESSATRKTLKGEEITGLKRLFRVLRELLLSS